MRHDSFSFASQDGVQVFVRLWLPDSAPTAVLQIAHGMGEHGGRYEALAERATAQGFLVCAHDHRGHGRSVVDGEALGHMGDDDAFNRAVADVHQLAGMLRDKYGVLPRALLGHSMGSFMVQQLLWQHPSDADAFVLSATNGPPPPIAAVGKKLARVERMRLGGRGHSKLIDEMTFRAFNRKFAPNRTRFDWLSRDDAQVDAYIADPLCGFECSVQSWIDLLDALDALTHPNQLARIPKHKPIYVFAGTADAVGDMGRGPRRLVDLYRGAWLTDVALRLYDGGRHEMLNEVNRDEVTADLLAWLTRSLGIAG